MKQAIKKQESSGWRLQNPESGAYLRVQKIEDRVHGEGYCFTTEGGVGETFSAKSEMEAIYAKLVSPSFVNSSPEFPVHGDLNLEKYVVVEVREIVEELQKSPLEKSRKFHLLRNINVNVIDDWEEYAEFAAFKKIARRRGGGEPEQMVIELKKTAQEEVSAGDFCFRTGEASTYFEIVSLTNIGERHFALLGYRSMGDPDKEV